MMVPGGIRLDSGRWRLDSGAYLPIACAWTYFRFVPYYYYCSTEDPSEKHNLINLRQGKRIQGEYDVNLT